MKTNKKKLGKRYDYDPEVDYPKIREANKRKLDEIMSNPDFMVELAKKYYGTAYLKAIEDGHYIRTEYAKAVNSGTVRAVNTKDNTVKLYEHTPIIQTLYKDGTEIEWDSAMHFCEYHGKKRTAAAQIVAICKGRPNTRKNLYKSSWRFKNKKEADKLWQ